MKEVLRLQMRPPSAIRKKEAHVRAASGGRNSLCSRWLNKKRCVEQRPGGSKLSGKHVTLPSDSLYSKSSFFYIANLFPFAACVCPYPPLPFRFSRGFFPSLPLDAFLLPSARGQLLWNAAKGIGTGTGFPGQAGNFPLQVTPRGPSSRFSFPLWESIIYPPRACCCSSPRFFFVSIYSLLRCQQTSSPCPRLSLVCSTKAGL